MPREEEQKPYNHDTATQEEKVAVTIKSLQSKIDSCKDPVMRETYMKVLAKMKAHHGLS